MGIDIGSRLVVGLPSEEVEVSDEILEDYCDSLDEWACLKGLDVVSPYFDAGIEDCVIGVGLGGTDYTYDCLGTPEELAENIKAAQKTFFEVVGKEGRIYVSANVW